MPSETSLSRQLLSDTSDTPASSDEHDASDKRYAVFNNPYKFTGFVLLVIVCALQLFSKLMIDVCSPVTVYFAQKLGLRKSFVDFENSCSFRVWMADCAPNDRGLGGSWRIRGSPP